MGRCLSVLWAWVEGGSLSATNRGAARSEADYYPTPAWCVQRLLDHVELPKGRWLEPSAGEGHILRAVHSIHPRLRIDAVELRATCRGLLELDATCITIGDFLQIPPVFPAYAVALGNPPFLLAQEFIEHSLRSAGQVVFLLRLSFLESQKREAFFTRVGVPDVFVLPERPSFTGEGTDSCAYAWMRWIRGKKQESRVSILYDKRQLSLLGGV